LAQECASCHSAQGAQKGIPAIAGRDVPSLIALLQLYRNGARTNPAMVSVAQSLDDKQIQAVAHYLASQGKSGATGPHGAASPAK
jgi:cytochrome c553